MSANTLHVKPASGMLVRHPDTMQKLAEAGEPVPDNGYWQRRLRDGDCELVADDATNPIAAASKAKPTTKAGEA